jgi:DmsE family decaheme c-type cytochrome
MRYPILTALAVLALYGTAAAARVQTPAAPAVASGYVGSDTCLTCHQDKTSDGYAHSLHARASVPGSPASRHGCETCHGPGQAHVDDPSDPAKIRVFTRLSPADASAACLTCHNRGTHVAWTASVHAARNLSCLTCHSVHHYKSATAQLVAVRETAVCATCHRAEATRTLQTEHMPVAEGKMSCSSCHNPHGSLTNVRMLRAGSSITESCVSCHAAQRGPFLWEHPVGRETCTVCHNPHGSSNGAMLVARLPLLCQRCHISSRHPSTLYDMSALGTASANRLVGRSCVNCHQNIHGSNHPAGNAFLR